MKIIIAGASIGGLLSAYKLGKAGNEVIVFDEKNYDNLGYNWYDFVWSDFFEELGFSDINIKSYRKNNMSFDIHSYNKMIRLNQSEQEREYAISRRELSHFLYNKAIKYSTIILNKHIDSLIVDFGCVKGIVVENENFFADLVIDNLGAFSTLRKCLPEDSGIEKEISKKSIMFAYRAIFNKPVDTTEIIDNTKCYLRHLNEEGISWVNVEEDDKVDVLIGRIGSLSLERANAILSNLKQENPCIGEKLLSGGKIYPIPIRHPSTRLFYDKYVMVGDSSFMTVPLLGSGIYASVIAASILCAILKNGDLSQENLYKYQQGFYSRIGKTFFEIDIIKMFLLNFDMNHLLVLFQKGVIDNKDITDIYNARPLNYSLKELLKKGIKGWRHPIILLKMLCLINKTKKIKKIASKMPENFDNKKLSAWQQKIARYFIT